MPQERLPKQAFLEKVIGLCDDHKSVGMITLRILDGTAWDLTQAIQRDRFTVLYVKI